MKHFLKENLKKLETIFTNMNLSVKLINSIICELYIMRKMKKSFHHKHIIFKFALLNLIHTDLCKFFLIEDYNKEQYFLLIIDNFTDMYYIK